jgi:hypothetical protein
MIWWRTIALVSNLLCLGILFAQRVIFRQKNRPRRQTGLGGIFKGELVSKGIIENPNFALTTIRLACSHVECSSRNFSRPK